jgi:hypothetical protein
VATGIAGTDAVNVLQLTEFGRNFPIIGNNTSGFAFPTATGADALAAGFGATAAGAKGAAFGTQATASGTNSLAIGPTAIAIVAAASLGDR